MGGKACAHVAACVKVEYPLYQLTQSLLVLVPATEQSLIHRICSTPARNRHARSACRLARAGVADLQTAMFQYNVLLRLICEALCLSSRSGNGQQHYW